MLTSLNPYCSYPFGIAYTENGADRRRHDESDRDRKIYRQMPQREETDSGTIGGKA